MCKSCGCQAQDNSQAKFYVKGFTENNVKETEKALLGLAGVNHVHIHAHDGLTAIDYTPGQTPLAEVTAVLAARGLQAVI